MPYANPQYLVETDWLAQHLPDANLRIFDVTGMLTSKLGNIAKERCYNHGHIPSAVFLDVASARGVLSDPSAQLPWMWPPKEQFERLMGQVGVRHDSQVVLYASTPRKGIDNGTMWCTRTWWVMHHFGVHCAVLNGSWEKWVSEGRPLSTSPASYPVTTFTAAPQWQRGVATKADVLAAIRGSGSTCVVDALSAASYGGTDNRTSMPRKGHITGAVNVPMYALVDQDTGVFASSDNLRGHFAQAGVLSADNVITYCGGAIAATVDAFALALLGHTNVAVYDGSLFEWAPDPSLPMTDPSRA